MTETTNPNPQQWAPQPQQPQAQQPQAPQGGAVPSWVPTAPAASTASAAEVGKKDGRPSTLVLAGAGSLLAVLAFLGGTAVGHAWGSSGSGTGQTQFNGPGGGFRQLPQQGQGQGQGQGQVPQQGQLPQQGQGQTQPGQTKTS